MSCDAQVLTYCVRRGERDPKRIRFRIDATEIATADRVIPDLTAITSVSLVMTSKRTGATETWSTVVVSQSADVAVYDHVLQASDTATLRTLHGAIWATAVGAVNPVLCGAFDLQVTEP